MQPLPVEEWDPKLADIIADMDGRPLEIHCLLANHPDLLRAWWSYRMHSVAGGELDQRSSELIILRVAVQMQSWYEWAAHVVRGLDAGLSLDEIQRVIEGPAARGWHRQDRALLDAVDQLISERRIKAAERQALGAFFSDRQVLDIVSLQSVYVGIACLIATWPVAVEDRIAVRLPASESEASFRQRLSASHRH